MRDQGKNLDRSEVVMPYFNILEAASLADFVIFLCLEATIRFSQTKHIDFSVDDMKRSDSVFATPPKPQASNSIDESTTLPSSSPAPHQPPQDPTKPFRFKRKRESSSFFSKEQPRKRRSSPPADPSIPRRDYNYHYHHHRSHRSRTTTSYCTTAPFDDPNAVRTGSYNPDTAFRESLFDALADDEGAAYWEGVYGQPIHTYPPFSRTGASFQQEDEDERAYYRDGKPRLERMSEEEYVSYVRSKMWEKSHQHISEERKKREEERKTRKAREAEHKRWRDSVEFTLGKRKERRDMERWRGVWDRYVGKWETTSVGSDKGGFAKRIAWPVESGVIKDVFHVDIERFFRNAPQAAGGNGGKEVDLAEVLKKERVRWHPDKMQQRAGNEGIDDETLKVITAVFQVVDRLWNGLKRKE